MKKFLLSLTVLTLSIGLFAQKKVADVAEFKSETIDLGKIKVSNPTTATFYVVNKGSDPLIIEQANPTCGCTIGDYTKQPIAPGKEGWIKATYNAANVGAFEKHLTVKFAGVDEMKSITIKGEVLNADDFSKQKGVVADDKSAAAEKTPTPVKPAEKAKTTTQPKAKSKSAGK